jgi:hypothetical protein
MCARLFIPKFGAPVNLRDDQEETEMGVLGALERAAVWQKGSPIPGYDPALWRRDAYGSAIKFSEYGNRNSDFGWEIDHYPVPNALGGSDRLSNLRPLNWKNNASHGGRLGDVLAGR